MIIVKFAHHQLDDNVHSEYLNPNALIPPRHTSTCRRVDAPTRDARRAVARLGEARTLLYRTLGGGPRGDRAVVGRRRRLAAAVALGMILRARWRGVAKQGEDLCVEVDEGIVVDMESLKAIARSAGAAIMEVYAQVRMGWLRTSSKLHCNCLRLCPHRG